MTECKSLLPHRLPLAHSTFHFPVPRLDLRSATAIGNIGLVKYAFSDEQPINLVLDTVLPICTGSFVETILWIGEQGVEVNASG
jgi:hypothetical protein